MNLVAADLESLQLRLWLGHPGAEEVEITEQTRLPFSISIGRVKTYAKVSAVRLCALPRGSSRD